MKVLLTGFEPFGGSTVNPSWQAVQRVHAKQGQTLITAELPVCWNEVQPKLGKLIELHRPDCIIMCGQAGGVTGITCERIGINLCDGVDNAGIARANETIDSDGAAAYFSTLPMIAIAENIRKGGISARLSLSAGAYLCNFALYSALRMCDGGATRVGFLHVPFLPEQVLEKAQASMALDLIVRGIELALECI